MIALSAVQWSAQALIYNAILFIDTSNNAWYNKTHWLICTPYLSLVASNVVGISGAGLSETITQDLLNKMRLYQVLCQNYPYFLNPNA